MHTKHTIIIPVFIAVLLLGARLHAQIFISSDLSQQIGEYNLDGSVVNASLITGLSDPEGMVLSGSDLFFVNETTNSINEYSLSGTLATPVGSGTVITGLSQPVSLALSGTDLFVTNFNGGGGNTVGEYTTTGGTLNASFITGLSGPSGLALSGSNLFVANLTGNTIGEYTTAGATVNASLITGLNQPQMIALSGSNLFVVNENGYNVGEYSISGTLSAPVNTGTLISGLNVPVGLALSGTDLYVETFDDNSVGEYNLSGSSLEVPLITNLGGPQEILVIPEPSTWVMLAMGGAGLFFALRRRAKV